MPGKPVFLLTDILIFGVLLTVLAFFLYAIRKPHLRQPWRQVVRSKTGVISMIVLAIYIGVALLDSVHFHLPLDNHNPDDQAGERRYSGEIHSLFDLIVSDLRLHTEKTYSAPFATHLYAKETVYLPDGTKRRIYPRLSWGASHLDDPARQRPLDILKLALIGAGKAVVAWLILMTLLCLYLTARGKIPSLRVKSFPPGGKNSPKNLQPTTKNPPAEAKIFPLNTKNFRAAAAAILHNQFAVPWRTAAITLAIVLLILFVGAEWAAKYHLLGTDKVGEDVLYQALKSIRTGVVIGTLTTLLMLPFAITLGVMAGYFRGWIDDVIQYLYTTLNSIPGVLLIAAAVLMLDVYMNKHTEAFTSLIQRADLRLLFLCLILGLTSWTGLCRLLRAETLKLRELDFIQAASAFGVTSGQTIFRHVLPNVMHIVLITLVLDFSGLVLAEAVLSYINIGVDPTMNSWGNMINSARLEMAREPVVWWSLAASLFFMFTLVLFANLFADVVRDALDPRLAKK